MQCAYLVAGQYQFLLLFEKLNTIKDIDKND